VIATLNANDPETLKLPGPVLIEQGTGDTTVFPNFTDQLAGELKGNGVKLTYKTYARVDHGTVVTKTAPADHATAWLEKRF
jgi:dipeptidyl aminopeptidase/acylaminoacyl peptidase